MILRQFFYNANAHPNKDFLLDENCRAVTYQAAAEVVKKLVDQLSFSSQVVLLSTNTIQFVLFFIAAAMKSSEVYVVNDEDLLEKSIKQLDSKAQIWAPDTYRHIVGALTDSEARPDNARANVACWEATVCFFSSGTTGEKKLLKFHAPTLYARSASWISNFSLGEADRFLCTTTFAHSHGLNIHLMPALVLGATLGVTDIRVMTLAGLLRIWRCLSPTVFTAMPRLYSFLLEEQLSIRLSDAKLVIAGSEPLNSELKAVVEEHYGVELLDQFGCAETGPLYIVEHVDERRVLSKVLNGKSVSFRTVWGARKGIYKMEVRSDAMVDEIITAGGVVVKPDHLIMDDLVEVKEGEASLLSRQESLTYQCHNAAYASAEQIEFLLESKIDGVGYLALKNSRNKFDVFYKATKNIRLEKSYLSLLLNMELGSVYKIDEIPRTAAGKKIRSIRAFNSPVVISSFDGRADCECWLSEHFDFIAQYDKNIGHLVTAKLNNPALYNSFSSAAIGFHNDAYDYESVPRFLALYCEQPAKKGGDLYVANVAASLSKIAPETLSYLKHRRFYFRTNPANYYGYPEQGVESTIVDNETIRFSSSYLEPLIPPDELSYVEGFTKALDSCVTNYSLKTGELLLFDNRKMVHRRTGFSGERKLYRYWLD